jgi:hypothetical protein
VDTDILLERPAREENEENDDESSYRSQLKKMKVGDLKAECKRQEVSASKHVTHTN